MKYLKLLLAVVFMGGFMASCGRCVSCTKATDPNITICQDEGTDSEYEFRIDYVEAQGWTCK